MEIVIGNGKVYITNIVDKAGRKGILFRPVEEARPIDSDEPDFMPDDEDYYPQLNDTIIWLENIEGARVLQDIVNGACLLLKGLEITKAKVL